MKRSLTVHFQSYPLALAEKEQLATASALFGNYDSTQSAMPILVTRNAEPIRRNSELIWQNIRFRNTKCIQSDRSILGLSVQGLVSHIIISISSPSWSDPQIDACLLSPLPVPPLTDEHALSHIPCLCMAVSQGVGVTDCCICMTCDCERLGLMLRTIEKPGNQPKQWSRLKVHECSDETIY